MAVCWSDRVYGCACRRLEVVGVEIGGGGGKECGGRVKVEVRDGECRSVL